MMALVARTALLLISIQIGRGQSPHFSFTLGALLSEDLLPRCQFSSTVVQLDRGRTQNESSWWDPETGFYITSVATSYPSGTYASAIEYVITLGANGSTATPALCNLSPLNVTTGGVVNASNGTTDIYRNRGSFANVDDFAGVNVSLATPGNTPPLPPTPPILNDTRVWGNVFHHDTTTGSPQACRDQCMAVPNAACGGMAFSELSDPSLNGCWLVTSVTQLTQQAGFSSWVASTNGTASSTTWAPTGGRSSDGELPFFTVVAGGVGRTFSVGWSGNWLATVTRGSDGSTTTTVTHPVLCAPLEPGDTLRSMRIIQVVFDATTPDSYHVGVNAHRRVMVDFKLPRASSNGALLGALVASWSWIGWPAPTLANQLWHVAAVKNSTSVEAYWLDAGWFNGGFPNGVGNWQLDLTSTVDVSEFPGATVAPLGVAAHADPNPVQFIVWFEPERVAAGTWIAQYEPGFLIPAGGDLLDLGNPAAWAYMRAYLSAAVGNYSLDVLRLDFNTEPAPNWAAADAPGRPGIVELRYIAGFYALWDAVLGDHPGLLIDDCASGGRRIDAETLSRSVPLWRSDNPGDSTQQQVQAMGLSGFAPISSGGVAWVDSYTWRSSGVTGKTADWGEAGWQMLMGNETALALLRAAVAETQRLRPAAIHGDYYPLTPIAYDDTLWAAYQFHCSAERTGCPAGGDSGWALVFRRPSTPPGPFYLALHGIAAGGQYRVATFNESYAETGSAVVPGIELAGRDVWLPVAGGGGGSSLLVEYSRLA